MAEHLSHEHPNVRDCLIAEKEGVLAVIGEVHPCLKKFCGVVIALPYPSDSSFWHDKSGGDYPVPKPAVYKSGIWRDVFVTQLPCKTVSLAYYTLSTWRNPERTNHHASFKHDSGITIGTSTTSSTRITPTVTLSTEATRRSTSFRLSILSSRSTARSSATRQTELHRMAVLRRKQM